MRKKIYQSPDTETISVVYNHHLLDWSAERIGGGGGNVLESKRGYLDATEPEYDEDLEDDENNGILPHAFSLWDE